MPPDCIFGIWLTFTLTARISSANGLSDLAGADIFLSTKFSLQRQPDGSHTFRSDPEYVKAACEESFQRLGVDTIDLYYCHGVDRVTPIEKTIEAIVELKKQAQPISNGYKQVTLTS